MTVSEVLDYFSLPTTTRGSQARWAKSCNISRQYVSQIVEGGEVPFSLQCELEIRTRGALVANREQLGPLEPERCPTCGAPKGGENA